MHAQHASASYFLATAPSAISITILACPRIANSTNAEVAEQAPQSRATASSTPQAIRWPAATRAGQGNGPRETKRYSRLARTETDGEVYRPARQQGPGGQGDEAEKSPARHRPRSFHEAARPRPHRTPFYHPPPASPSSPFLLLSSTQAKAPRIGSGLLRVPFATQRRHRRRRRR